MRIIRLITMIVMIGVSLLVNIPLGIYLCYHFKINRFIKILGLGVIQLLSTTGLIAVFIAISDTGGLLDTVIATLSLWAYASIIFLPITAPLILLTALGIWFFRRENRPE